MYMPKFLFFSAFMLLYLFSWQLLISLSSFSLWYLSSLRSLSCMVPFLITSQAVPLFLHRSSLPFSLPAFSQSAASKSLPLLPKLWTDGRGYKSYHVVEWLFGEVNNTPSHYFHLSFLQLYDAIHVPLSLLFPLNLVDFRPEWLRITTRTPSPVTARQVMRK